MTATGLLFVITVVVAWVGGALSVWLTRHDARTTRLMREIGYLNATLEDLAEVVEANTRVIESRSPKPEPYMPGPHIGTTEPDAKSVTAHDAQNTEKEQD